ncbi:DUF2279 domain-containing protein, partial [bacterium]
TTGITEGFYTRPGWPARKAISAVTVGGILCGSLVSSYYDWWNGQSRQFHFNQEGWFNDYSLGIDKAGHTYTSYFYFHAFRNLMLWGGFRPSTAYWWAAGTTAFFALSIEVGDGFSPYGFSVEDLAANGLGLAYAMLQTKWDFLRNINLKWSYVPPDGYRWPPHFTEHYDGHAYWLTFNMHNLLPGKIGATWPEFLQLGVGYGVHDHVTKRELVIGLDLNLGAFSVQNQDLLLLSKTVDMFRLPLPAVEFTEGKAPRAYLFYTN